MPVDSVLPEGTLGPLETKVMQVVWAHEAVTTRVVYQQLLRQREIAYTTVMTIMRNLTRKGFLNRYLKGRAYLYRATVTQEEITRSQVAKVIGALMDRFAEPAISYLIGRLSTIDEAGLTELEAEVARLRRHRATHPEATSGKRAAEKD